LFPFLGYRKNLLSIVLFLVLLYKLEWDESAEVRTIPTEPNAQLIENASETMPEQKSDAEYDEELSDQGNFLYFVFSELGASGLAFFFRGGGPIDPFTTPTTPHGVNIWRALWGRHFFQMESGGGIFY
jgi:hypothetical protein